MLARNSKIATFALSMLAFTYSPAFGQSNYAEQNKTILRSVLGNDFKNYYFRSTPVSGFGIGTMFSTERRPLTEQRIYATPATWFARSVSKENRDAIMSRIVVSEDSGNVDLSGTKGHNNDLNASLPGLFNILGIGGNTSSKNGVTVKLGSCRFTTRMLNSSEFVEALHQQVFQDYVRRHYEDKDYLMVVGDVVLEDYDLLVTVDATSNKDLDAALKSKVGKVLGTDSSFKVGVSSDDKYRYHVKCSTPLVVALYIRKPNRRGQMGDPGNPEGQLEHESKIPEITKEILFDAPDADATDAALSVDQFLAWKYLPKIKPKSSSHPKGHTKGSSHKAR